MGSQLMLTSVAWMAAYQSQPAQATSEALNPKTKTAA